MTIQDFPIMPLDLWRQEIGYDSLAFLGII